VQPNSETKKTTSYKLVKNSNQKTNIMETLVKSRTIEVISTRGQEISLQTTATTWGALKEELRSHYKDIDELKAVVGRLKVTLEHKDALIPEGDFLLALMPYKSKSGAVAKKAAKKAAPKKAAAKAAPAKKAVAKKAASKKDVPVKKVAKVKAAKEVKEEVAPAAKVTAIDKNKELSDIISGLKDVKR
jgi:hypothetical protein